MYGYCFSGFVVNSIEFGRFGQNCHGGHRNACGCLEGINGVSLRPIADFEEMRGEERRTEEKTGKEMKRRRHEKKRIRTDTKQKGKEWKRTEKNGKYGRRKENKRKVSMSPPYKV